MAARFCGQCGAPLNPDDRFCRTCGAPSPVEAPPPDATLGWRKPAARQHPRWLLPAIGGVVALLVIGGVAALVLRGGGGASDQQPNTADGLKAATITFTQAFLDASAGKDPEPAYRLLTRACRDRFSAADLGKFASNDLRTEFKRQNGIDVTDVKVTDAKVRNVRPDRGESAPVLTSSKDPGAADKINGRTGFGTAFYEEGGWRFGSPSAGSCEITPPKR